MALSSADVKRSDSGQCGLHFSFSNEKGPLQSFMLEPRRGALGSAAARRPWGLVAGASQRRANSSRRGRFVLTALGPAIDPAFRAKIQLMLDENEEPNTDPDRPTYHVMARSGWLNDPNGPILVDGRYHIFYQHVMTGCEWDWGLVWGHATSTDLIHWEHLPVALRPSAGAQDADGCFSGCCTTDVDGTPTILYTGVRLRSNPECGPLPPQECDLQLPFIETQMIATADVRDGKLLNWRKVEQPMVPLPPPNLPLEGWRDPFIIQRGDSRGKEWVMLVGTGLRNQGGTVLVYRSPSLHSGWQVDGYLCKGDSTTGAMWECPLLLELQQHPVAAGSRSVRELPVKYTTASMDLCPPRPTALGAQIRDASLTPNSGSYELLNVSGPSTAADGGNPSGEAGEADRLHFFCISPDAPTNPSLYWLGNYNSETRKFDMEHAQGPFRLDLGDTIYAPNIMTDARGRHLLWGWIQERRRVASGYSYSGCLSSPRVLWNRNGRLVQEPLPEVEQLRSGVSWCEQQLRLPQDEPVPLQGVSGMALDIHVKLQRGSAAAAGLILRSWNTEGSGVLLLDWDRSQLEMAWEGMDPVTMQYSLEAETARRVGGPVQLPPEGQPVGLRLLLDHSCLEVFLDTGEALTTRCYRGKPPQDTDCGIDLIALGGTAVALEVEVHEMLSIWSAPSALPLLDRSGMPSSSASMDDAVLFSAEQSPQLIPSFDATVQLSI